MNGANIATPENKWQLMVDAFPEMIAIIDKNRRVAMVNRSTPTIFGKTEVELIGQCCFTCSNESSCLHTACMENSKPQTKELHFEKEGEECEPQKSPVYRR